MDAYAFVVHNTIQQATVSRSLQWRRSIGSNLFRGCGACPRRSLGPAPSPGPWVGVGSGRNPPEADRVMRNFEF